MSRVYFTRLARRDLLEILSYISRDNPRAATAFVQRIETKCRELARIPDMGFPRDELEPGLRVWPVKKYLIFYRIAPDGIEVARVVHGARDVERLFE